MVDDRDLGPTDRIATCFVATSPYQPPSNCHLLGLLTATCHICWSFIAEVSLLWCQPNSTVFASCLLPLICIIATQLPVCRQPLATLVASHRPDGKCQSRLLQCINIATRNTRRRSHCGTYCSFLLQGTILPIFKLCLDTNQWYFVVIL